MFNMEQNKTTSRVDIVIDNSYVTDLSSTELVENMDCIHHTKGSITMPK
jgi:hypothetical protein